MSEVINEIIKVEPSNFGGELIQAVNARDLHQFLEIKEKFTAWIQRMISDFSFKENQDFTSFSEISEKPQGGRPTIEYVISLSMAKELAMVSRTAKGKAARLYFIECERRAKEAEKASIPRTFAEALRLAAKQAEEVERLNNQIKADTPKVAFADSVVASGKETTITGAAKILGIRPRKFFDWLRVNGYLYLQGNQAKESAIKSGLMVVRYAKFTRESTGEQQEEAYAHVTGKGIVFFYKKLLKEGLVEYNSDIALAA